MYSSVVAIVVAIILLTLSNQHEYFVTMPSSQFTYYSYRWGHSYFSIHIFIRDISRCIHTDIHTHRYASANIIHFLHWYARVQNRLWETMVPFSKFLCFNAAVVNFCAPFIHTRIECGETKTNRWTKETYGNRINLNWTCFFPSCWKKKKMRERQRERERNRGAKRPRYTWAVFKLLN